MKQFLQIAGFIYVSFAILIATESLATLEATVKRNAGQRIHLDTAAQVIRDSERLVGPGEGIGPYDPANFKPQKPRSAKSYYTVVAWTSNWCYPCKQWKTKELPALLKAKIKVTVRDFDTGKPPKSIKSVPTVILYYKGKEVHRDTYWKAKDVLKYIDNHLSLKGKIDGKEEASGHNEWPDRTTATR